MQTIEHRGVTYTIQGGWVIRDGWHVARSQNKIDWHLWKMQPDGTTIEQPATEADIELAKRIYDGHG